MACAKVRVTQREQYLKDIDVIVTTRLVPLAGIEQVRKSLKIRDFFRRPQSVLTVLLIPFLVPIDGWFGSFFSWKFKCGTP
jgi:hypothetical protein